ncbi:MBL fold metallo-hydrolase [Candidatus Chloroploca asiatica]|uniref:MBL fold metallo-hydrolase n=1 Tax=Candidatus Chloroploca asiatica TaxID=1506545 RepID=A0A2H3L1H6_9CHLR|nr:MBL fold metallo-hydrolase [Candidatus Chloroploca asiatica]PDV97007.1 MBL fold metallo-hydrolase [Candidatus Chloroploca asiatica]
MWLRFLGTGTSMGVPVIGCKCAVCTSSDPRNRRLRTAALLSTGTETILIDAGPDFREQALIADLCQLDAVLITHSHFDHTAGIDDLRPLCWSGRAIPLYGSPQTLGDVRARFAYAFTDTSAGSTRPSLDLRPVVEPFTVGSLTIQPFDVLHGSWTITGYRVGRLGYITDASALSPTAWTLLRDLDVLVLNALRYEPHPTHYSVAQALEVVAALQPRRAFFVHMNHNIDHALASLDLPEGVAFAYDGLEVQVEL